VDKRAHGFVPFGAIGHTDAVRCGVANSRP
jgi:hypothetical protein